MADFELFNGTNLEEPDSDHRIAMNKPSLAGAFFVRWDNFKNLIRSFTVSKDTDQSISGNKTFTGIVNVQAPASDNNPVTLKYFNDNAGGGGGTLTFDTSFELTAYLTNPDREAGQLATCLDLGYEDVILRLSNDTTEWDVIEATVYATQEQAIECIETAVVMNPLRSAQQWVYNVLTRTFEELTTASKTIIGAINELKSAITDILTELGLKATQNTGVCARCRIYPADIVVDPIAMTVSVVTVRNGQNISASCPLRFFTDGDGVIHKWEFYAPITASFTKINGIWGFYINQTGQVLCDQTPWSDFATVAPIYRFYLNDQLPNSEMIEPVCYEAHTTDTSASDHEWMHAQGTIHVSGFDHVSNQLILDANGRPTTAPNADGRNTVIALTTGKSSDDGLAHTVTNSTDGAQFSQDLGNTTAASLNATNSALFRIRTNDTVGRLSFLPATRFSFPWNTVNNSPQFITTLGVRTDVSNERWFVVFVYDFPDYVNGRAVKIVTATQDFTTYALATAYQWESIQDAYPTMRDKEIRPLYKEIYYCDKSVGATYPVECKYSALCSTTDIRTLNPVQTSATSGAVLASNVSVVPTTDFTSTDQQSFDVEAGTRIVKLESNETPAAIADTDNVRFKSGTGYYVRTLLAIKNYVKSGLRASEVVNDSTIVLSPTVKDAFDNADCVAVTSLQDTDMIPFARANGAVSENKMVDAVNAKTYFQTDLSPFYSHSADTSIHFTKNSINFSDLGSTAHTHTVSEISDFYNASYSASYNVTSWQEIVDILAVSTVPSSVVFNVMNDIVGGTLQTFAHNVIIRGCRVIAPSIMQITGYEDGVYNINFESLYYNNIASVIMVGNDEFTTTINIKFKDITSLWYVTSTDYNLQCIKGGTGTTASIEYNTLTNTKLDVTTSLVPTQNNNYYKWNYYYDIYMFNIDSEIHFLCDRAGKFSVRCRYLCSTTSNRTITLIPPLPLKLCLYDLVNSAIEISTGDTYVYGTEIINKFRYNNEPLAISSTFSDLDDKIEYRNNTGIGTIQYTSTGGIVDISTSGLTLDLNYDGSATGFVRKEIVIIGIITKKLQ